MIINPRNPGVTSPHPKSKIDPQLTRLAIPRLPISLANLGSLSEEMEEAFGNIAKARQDTAIASTSTSHTQCVTDPASESGAQYSNVSQADSLISSWLHEPPLSSESPSLLDQLLQNSTPKRTRRGDFSWRFSPMKEPSDFERVKRQWWGSKRGTSRATAPLREQSSDPEDQCTDMILAPLSTSAGSDSTQNKEAHARRSDLAETALTKSLRPKPFCWLMLTKTGADQCIKMPALHRRQPVTHWRLLACIILHKTTSSRCSECELQTDYVQIDRDYGACRLRKARCRSTHSAKGLKFWQRYGGR